MKLNEVHNIDEAMMAGGQEAYATEAKPDAYTRDQMAATAGFGRRPREHDTGDDEPKGVFTVVIDGRDWKTATSNEAFRMANAVAHKHPGKRVQVRWPTGQLNTVAEGLAMGMEEEFVGEPEHDGSTFKNSLHTIHRVAVYLNKNISDDDDIPEWVAEKMGAAKGMLTSVMQYLISEKEMHHGEADIYEQGVAEDLTKLPSGDYQNSHTGVRSSKPPAKKKRGEKTWAEWDAIEKAKKEKGVAEGVSDVVKGVKRAVKGKTDPTVAVAHRSNEYIKAVNTGDKDAIRKTERNLDRVNKVTHGKIGEQGVAEGNYSDEANPIRDDGNEPPDYAAMYENKLVEFAGGMGTGSVATAPGVGKGSNVGSLFGGSYSQKNSPFKKTKAKKESVIKR